MRSAQGILFGMLLALGACDSAPTSQEAVTEAEPEALTAPPPEAPVTLDLSREHLPVDDELVEVGEAENLLPDLVGNQAESGKVKLSGSVITDKEALTLRDKVDGAEVKLEVKTP